MQSATLMKVLATIIFFAILASCNSPRVVTMPYRNYLLSADRMMPLPYSDAKQSIRIWLSRSTSVDTVFAVSLNQDSSYSAFRMELGQKYKSDRTAIPYFTKTKIEPSGGILSFFQRLDSLNLFAYEDQKETEVVLHEPIALCIVEYLKDKKYNKFSFQLDQSNSKTEHENYRFIEDFMKREFNLEGRLR